MTVLFAILALGTAVLFHVLYTTIDAWHAKRLASMV